jgi:hypothetical protein
VAALHARTLVAGIDARQSINLLRRIKKERCWGLNRYISPLLLAASMGEC